MVAHTAQRLFGIGGVPPGDNARAYIWEKRLHPVMRDGRGPKACAKRWSTTSAWSRTASEARPAQGRLLAGRWRDG